MATSSARRWTTTRDRLVFLWEALGPIFVGAIVGGLFVWFGPGKPTSPFRKDYYSAVAQLVPVLMLALAVESRVLSAAFARGPRRPSRNRADQWLMDHDGWLPFMIVGLPMLTLAVGELSAIAALGGTSPRFPAWCTDFALGLGIGAIATVPVWNRAGDAHPAGAAPR
jgi:hypothetical protein